MLPPHPARLLPTPASNAAPAAGARYRRCGFPPCPPVPATGCRPATPNCSRRHSNDARVLQVVVMVRRRLGSSALEVADILVIACQDRVALAQVQLHQRAMPPQMMHEVVAEMPVAAPAPRASRGLRAGRQSISSTCALTWCAKKFVGVLRQRGVHRGFGAGVVAGFLMRESPYRAEAVIARQVRRPAPAPGGPPAPARPGSGRGETRWCR